MILSAFLFNFRTINLEWSFPFIPNIYHLETPKIMKWSTFTLLALSLFLANPLSAQLAEVEILSYGPGSHRVIRSADIDQDGDVDVIAGSADQILVYTNQGGYFDPVPRILVEGFITFTIVELVDLDGDSDIDILSKAASDSDHIAWYENDGEGNFGPENIISTPSNTNSLQFVAGDLDGDNLVDVLVDDGATSFEFFWMKNQGNGQFEAGGTIDLGLTVGSDDLDLVDIDGDEDLDFINAGISSEITWFPNDGAGNFGPKIVVDTNLDDVLAVKGVDLDNDGDIDIVATSGPDDQLGWYENDGNNQFGPYQSITTDIDGPRHFVVVDLNEDNLPDIASASINDNTIAWFANNGDGQFGSKNIVSSEVLEAEYIISGDFNQDGRPDLLAKTGVRVRNAWFQNLGNGAFGSGQVITDLTTWSSTIKTFDLDSDGDEDILYFSREALGWMQNDGTGKYGIPIILYEHNASSTLGGYDAGDLDHDGDIDLIASLEGKLVWVENTGSGKFEPPLPVYEFSPAEFPEHIDLADLNRDGNTDILISIDDYPNIIWFQSLGNGQFAGPTTLISLNAEVTSIFAEDVNGDTHPDIVVSTDTGGEHIFWHENLGDGNFGGLQYVLDDFGLGQITINLADLDLDGDLDIITNVLEGAWFENDGFGQFSTPQPLSTGISEIDHIFPFDMDLDFDKDLIVTSEGNADSVRVHLIRNEGMGVFGEMELLYTLHKDYSSVVEGSDIDGDGDIDLFAVNGNVTTSNTIEVRRNLSTNNFPFISGTLFWDENENGIFDSSEQPLDDNLIEVEPAPLFAYFDQAGGYQYFLSNGNYEVNVKLTDCLKITTDSTSYQVTIDSLPVGDLDFGIYHLNSGTGLYRSFLSSGLPRCGTTVPFWLDVENISSCIPSNGKVAIVLDDSTSFVTASPMPVEVAGDTLFWEVENLTFGTTMQIRIDLAMNGLPGNEICIPVLNFIDPPGGGNPIITNTDNYKATVLCSYDPNDKQVRPARGGSNYTLFDEELIYTVRFQNTGNDTAFTVIIRDFLDPNLDWTTVHPISASHPFEMDINYLSGRLTFTFNEILLPDSTTNEAESQGYVLFSVQALEDLSEYTEIRNTAHIYFDVNPAIITNTVKNTMVSEFRCTDGIGLTGENIPAFSVESETTGISCTGNQDGSLQLIPAGGTGIFSFEWITNDATGSTVDTLSAGIYSIVVSDSGNCVDTISVEIEEPSPLDLSPITQEVSCADGTDGAIDIQPTGATPPYSFMWNTGDTLSNINNLSAGIYHLTVTDVNNCTDSLQVEITEPVPLVVSLKGTTVPCYDSETSLAPTVVGGTPPYSFTWSNGSIDSLLQQVGIGEYELELTDDLGCQSFHTVFITGPDSLTLGFVNIQDASDYNDGSIHINDVSGGSPPYEFLWDTGASGPFLENVISGPYQVTITDSNDCEYVFEFEVGTIISAIDRKEHHSVRVHPNPFSGQVQVQADFIDGNGLLTLEVFNSRGQQHLKKEVSFENGQIEFNIHESAFPSRGVYWIRLRMENWTWSEKVVKIN
jgi:uncharacterized repeat protein (TIGR01451 family)